MALHMAVVLAAEASQGLGGEGANFEAAPHAQVEYLGEGPSEGDLNLACGLLTAVSSGEGTATGEGDVRMFLEGVEGVADRVSKHDALPLFLDLGDLGGVLPGEPGKGEGSGLVEGLEVQGAAPHNHSEGVLGACPQRSVRRGTAWLP